jgi:hypothetical protein
MRVALLLVIFITLHQSYSKLYQVVTLLNHGARYHINDLYDGN